MMADVLYVLPDTIRGGPADREALALRSGCDLVEVSPGDAPPPGLPWLLRASSMDEEGADAPRWYDRSWTAGFIGGLVDQYPRAPVTVVIDPGNEWSRPKDIVRAIGAIRDRFHARCAESPAVLVANRAAQSIPDGQSLEEFWSFLVGAKPDLAVHAGIALNVPELYAVARSRLEEDLARVPLPALRYVRVHTRGRRPDLGDPLPWRAVFGLVRRAPSTVLIAPAVDHTSALEPAILFCMVSLQGRAFT